MPNSYNQYTGDGSTTLFVAPSYLDQDDIHVYVDNVEDTNFTWNNSTTVDMDSAPANNAVVQVRRETPIDTRNIDFTGGSALDPDSLDRDALQLFYAMQEIVDDFSDTLQLDTDDEYDADSKEIKNLADPTDAQDAVTKNYLDTTFTSDLNTAVTDAETAETGAQTAQTAAETAQTAAETAQTAAETAQTAAETAQTGAETAETNAETAETNAGLEKGYAEEWANKAEDSLVSAAAGGDQVDDYSALHHAAKAAASVASILSSANEYTKTQNFDETAITSSANSVAWDLESNQVAVHTLTENTTFAAPTNNVAGAQYVLTIIQDSTERTVSWNAEFKWENDIAPTIPSGSGERIILVFKDDGTNLWGQVFYTEA